MSSINFSCVICDDVRKEISRKHTLVGVYNDRILFQKSEWEKSNEQLGLPQLFFACFASNVPHGKSKLVWWLEDPEGELFLTDKKKEVEMNIQDNSQAIFVKLAPTVFKKLGTYTFNLKIAKAKYTKTFTVGLTEKIVS